MRSKKGRHRPQEPSRFLGEDERHRVLQGQAGAVVVAVDGNESTTRAANTRRSLDDDRHLCCTQRVKSTQGGQGALVQQGSAECLACGLAQQEQEVGTGDAERGASTPHHGDAAFLAHRFGHANERIVELPGDRRGRVPAEEGVGGEEASCRKGGRKGHRRWQGECLMWKEVLATMCPSHFAQPTAFGTFEANGKGGGIRCGNSGLAAHAGRHGREGRPTLGERTRQRRSSCRVIITGQL
mmetsp:Transcript_6427/g.20840  ORF Transcript_6427/g.20840 Transcript_6427/m.20840 type:complete len:240 (-) Transcript_6427:314-1033(-)